MRPWFLLCMLLPVLPAPALQLLPPDDPGNQNSITTDKPVYADVVLYCIYSKIYSKLICNQAIRLFDNTSARHTRYDRHGNWISRPDGDGGTRVRKITYY